MVTKEQAMTCNDFHYGRCSCVVGPRGGIKKSTIARRSGQTQTWKRDVGRFRVPVKHGLYESSAITDTNAHEWHCAHECLLQKESKRDESQGL